MGLQGELASREAEAAEQREQLETALATNNATLERLHSTTAHSQRLQAEVNGLQAEVSSIFSFLSAFLPLNCSLGVAFSLLGPASSLLLFLKKRNLY